MRKVLLFIFLLLCINAYADNEHISALLTDAIGNVYGETDPNKIGLRNPGCSDGLNFTLSFATPVNCNLVKSEWFRNDVLLATHNYPVNDVLQINFVPGANNIVAKVTYQRLDGSYLVLSSNVITLGTKSVSITSSFSETSLKFGEVKNITLTFTPFTFPGSFTTSDFTMQDWQVSGGTYVSSTSKSITVQTDACSDLTIKAMTNLGCGVVGFPVNSTLKREGSNFIISGSSSICSSSVYTVPNLPVGASVTWSASPNNIVSLTTNGNDVTVNKVADGNPVLTANITNYCAVSIPITKNIVVGLPIIVFHQPYVCEGEAFSLCTDPIYGNVISKKWVAKGQNGVDIELEENPNGCVDIPANAGYLYVDLTVTTDCGTVKKRQLIRYANCGTSAMFSISPNPATSIVNIQPKSTVTSNMSLSKSSTIISTITQVNIYDRSGNLKRQQRCNGNSTREQVNISGLSKGLYFVEIITKERKEKQTLMIQ